MTAYFIGDIPGEALIVVPTSAGNAIEVDDFDEATAVLLDPNYQPVAAEFAATIQDGDVSVGWPDTSPLETQGIYSLVLKLTGDGGTITADPWQFVVQDFDGWHTLSTARAAWTTGAPRQDVLLYSLLASARAACIEWAPQLADGAPIPQGYRDGQLLQARNTLNGLKIDPSSESDAQALGPIRPYPLDSFVKALLKPKTRVPRFG